MKNTIEYFGTVIKDPEVMKKAIFASAFLLAFAITVFGQDDGPKPDRWRGLVIDQSSPEDAIKAFGKPAKERLGAINTNSPIDARLTRKIKEKTFKVLHFKKIEGLENLVLGFHDGKLVMIFLHLNKEKEFSPHSLGDTYNLRFDPMFTAADQTFGMITGDMERDQGKVYPKIYPTIYYMVAEAKTTFVSAMVGNAPTLAGAFGRSLGIPTPAGTFPGKVAGVVLISRTLENRADVEILK